MACSLHKYGNDQPTECHTCALNWLGEALDELRKAVLAGMSDSIIITLAETVENASRYVARTNDE